VHPPTAHLAPAFVHARFPLLSEACARVGLDLASDRVPVGPAAHYVMGGVQTDIDGRTSIPGIYAAGEVACTGVHGANRLASNSLLEGLVFGARAGCAMRSDPPDAWPFATPKVVEFDAARNRRAEVPAGSGEPVTIAGVQDAMWRQVGLFRDREGLSRALAVLDPAWRAITARIDGGEPLEAGAWRDASILTVGRLIARAALRREESRGGHYRSDFPQRDDIHWKRRASETREGN
jgi:L-aspartate oxidase